MEDCKEGRKPVQDSRNADKGRARACVHSVAIIVTFSTAEERRTSSQSCVPHLSVCVCLSWPLCVATVWSVGQTNKNGASQGHRQRGRRDHTDRQILWRKASLQRWREADSVGDGP